VGHRGSIPILQTRKKKMKSEARRDTVKACGGGISLATFRQRGEGTGGIRGSPKRHLYYCQRKRRAKHISKGKGSKTPETSGARPSSRKERFAAMPV